MTQSLQYKIPDTASQEEKQYLKQYGSKLSDSTQYAKWISSINEHENYPGQSLVTRSHDVIKHWAEKRHATPATIPETEHDNHLGVLRFNFPGFGGQKLEEVSWDKWFKTFDERKLVFLYQEKLKNGHESNFFHFDSPLREHD